jgi:hypothetical protein
MFKLTANISQGRILRRQETISCSSTSSFDVDYLLYSQGFMKNEFGDIFLTGVD